MGLGRLTDSNGHREHRMIGAAEMLTHTKAPVTKAPVPGETADRRPVLSPSMVVVESQHLHHLFLAPWKDWINGTMVVKAWMESLHDHCAVGKDKA